MGAFSTARWAWTAMVGALLVCAFACGAARADSPLEDEPAIQAIQFAEETWADEYAGAWLDFDYPHTDADYDRDWLPDQKVFFAFTVGAEEKVAELRDRFPATNPYVAVTHTYSYAALRQLQREVTGDLRAYMTGELEIPGPAFSWHSTGIWVVDNVVEVNLSEVTPEYEAWAAERYGAMAPALHVFAGPEVVPISGRLIRAKKKCGPACRKAKAAKKARVKARKKALRKKCRRASRVAARTGSPKAKRIVRSKRCRAIRR